MQEYSRAPKSVQRQARMCKGKQECAKASNSVRKALKSAQKQARLWESKQKSESEWKQPKVG